MRWVLLHQIFFLYSLLQTRELRGQRPRLSLLTITYSHALAPDRVPGTQTAGPQGLSAECTDTPALSPLLWEDFLDYPKR